MVVVSLMTEVPPLQQIRGLTYGTVSQEEKAKSRSSWTWGDVAASLLVIAIIIGAYVYFNG
jgi:SSS family solute:Na+ symporter